MGHVDRRGAVRPWVVGLCILALVAGCFAGGDSRVVLEGGGENRVDTQPVTAIAGTCPAELTSTAAGMARSAARMTGPEQYDVRFDHLPHGYRMVGQHELAETKAIPESIGLAPGYDTWTEVLIIARGPWETTTEYATVVVAQAGKAVLCDTLRRTAAPRARAVEVGEATAILVPRRVPSRATPVDTLMWLANDTTMLQVNSTALSHAEMLELAAGIRLVPASR
jgi:hypothetical protein